MLLGQLIHSVRPVPSTAGGSNTGESIGKGSWYDGEYFSGSIDDIRIYNRALSEEEVGMLYEEEAPDSASFLTKVTAPDKVAADLFGASVSQSGDILAVGVQFGSRWNEQCRCRLFVSLGKQWHC